MRTLLALLIVCVPALAQQTPAVKLTLQEGAVVGLTNGLTGETYTRPSGPATTPPPCGSGTSRGAYARCRPVRAWRR
jgi:hypothetical protein